MSLLNRDPAACPPAATCSSSAPARPAAPRAITLARAGFDVVLVDQHAFPRDKVCGDGLIPDAHNALRRLGVLDEVMALAQPRGHVGCIGPRGGRVDVPGTLAVLPRTRARRHPVPRRGRGRRAHVRAGALRGAARGGRRASSARG